jgi:hypothetical protein
MLRHAEGVLGGRATLARPELMTYSIIGYLGMHIHSMYVLRSNANTVRFITDQVHFYISGPFKKSGLEESRSAETKIQIYLTAGKVPRPILDPNFSLSTISCECALF